MMRRILATTLGSSGFEKAAALAGSALVGFLAAPSAHAYVDFSPGNNFSAVSDAAANSLIKTVGIGADYRAFMPASPLGLLVGVDIGVDATSITLPQSFQTAMGIVTGNASNVPGSMLLPRLSVHKGLPLNLDVGLSYFAYNTSSYNNKVFAGSLKWAVIKGGMTAPAVAVRASETFTQLFFMTSHTYKVDALVSKSLPLIEPYVGGGLQFGAGDISLPQGGANGLPAGTNTHQSFSALHFYGGLPLSLAIFKLTGEFDYSLAGMTSYGLKASLAF